MTTEVIWLQFVCCDKVYAIGGDNNYNGCTILDTIESIQVSPLLEMTETSMTRQNTSQWTRLQCHLSSPQRQCAAVVVHNHYIVIMGGLHNLSSVDIINTAPPHNNNNNSNSNGETTIVAGPSMNVTQSSFGAAVMDNLSAINLSGISLVPEADTEQGPYK